MNSSDDDGTAAALANLESMKQESERLQDLFRRHREDLRAEAIHAVEELGLSVLRVATTAGIDRRTVSVWLEVHRAEKKSRKK